jgi:hypothetical protein
LTQHHLNHSVEVNFKEAANLNNVREKETRGGVLCNIFHECKMSSPWARREANLVVLRESTIYKFLLHKLNSLILTKEVTYWLRWGVMLSFSAHQRYFLFSNATDMRKCFSGLLCNPVKLGSSSILVIIFILNSHSCQSHPFQ